MRDAGLSIKAWLDINDNNYDTVIFIFSFLKKHRISLQYGVHYDSSSVKFTQFLDKFLAVNFKQQNSQY